MTTIVFQTEAVERREYVCHTCGKAFKRSEHCSRHERAHTNERPFKCRFCNRRYARKDLLRRHEKTLHAECHEANSTTVAQEARIDHQDASGPATDIRAASDIMTAGAERTSEGSDVASSINATNAGLITDTDHLQGLEEHLFDFSTPYDNAVTGIDFAMTTMSDSTSFEVGFDPTFPTGQLSEMDLRLLTNENGLSNAGDLLSLFQHTQQGDTHAARDHGSGTNDFVAAVIPPSISLDGELHGGNHGSRPSDFQYGNLPSISKVEYVKPLCPRISNDQRDKMLRITPIRENHPEDAGLRLPSADLLSQYLRTFVDNFGVHMPFIHIPSLDMDNMAAPLLLSMCAIGALLRLEQAASINLSIEAGRLLKNEVADRRSARYGSERFQHLTMPSSEEQPDIFPLWLLQAKLLLTWFRAFTGTLHIVTDALDEFGFLVSVSRGGHKSCALSERSHRHTDGKSRKSKSMHLTTLPTIPAGFRGVTTKA